MHIASGDRPIALGIKRARLRANIATNRLLMAAMRLRLLAEKANFNPSQPRVPAGESEGGQWTAAGGGGGVRPKRLAEGNEEETKPNRSIIDEFVDPVAELRTEAYNNKIQAIRQLEPDNPQLFYATSPNYIPSQQTVDEVDAELEAARGRVADRIGRGHAFDEHVDEFNASTPDDLSSIARSVIENPSAQVRNLVRGRTSFYLPNENTLVIVDPASRDSGTIFKPTRGQSYVDDLLKSK